MANIWGYPVIQTDIAGLVITGGLVEIVDASGTPYFPGVPSGIVRSIVRNDVGNYSIILQEAWVGLVDANISTVIADGYSPGVRHPQIQEITVGDSSVLPVQAGGPGQSVTFQVYDDANPGQPVEIEGGGQFTFSLILKASSA